jgi:membrane carboxypeptidase/penicillin-binding protein PbpC
MVESTNTALSSAQSSNVLSFPKKNQRVNPPSEDERAREATRRLYVDEVVDAYTNHLANKLAQQGFDVFTDNFDKHFGFTMEAFKSTLLMTMGLEHPFQEVIEQTVQTIKSVEPLDDDFDPA